MGTLKKDACSPDKKLAAVCGLFCPSCEAYLAGSIPEKRVELAQVRGFPPDEFRCGGCRSQHRHRRCRACGIVSCAKEKGVDFCGECGEYPCAALKDFQAKYPHRIELWRSHARINEVGWERWFGEMLDRFACPRCGAINSAYHLSCHECGSELSNAFVAEHEKEIKAFFAGRSQGKK